MKRPVLVPLVVLLFLAWMPFCAGAEEHQQPPKVIATTPKNGDLAVDPSTRMITVTFDKRMRDKSWSWGYEDKNAFPQVTGEPYYTDRGTTCVLPVRLKSGKRYVIKINSVKFRKFKDTQGNAAESYSLTFTTQK